MRTKLFLAGVLLCFRAAFGQSQLIGNGGFENFPTTVAPAPWQTGPLPWGDNGAAVIGNQSGFAHSGSQFLVLGNIVNADQTVFQTITIPSNIAVAVLNYYWAVVSQDTLGIVGDHLKVSIVSTNLNILATVDQESNFSTPQNFYLQKAFDLTPYIGQTISVYFSASTDPVYGGQTAFLIDDVSVQVATSTNLPANDSFTNRMVLSGTSVTNSATNTFATKEPGEPSHGGNIGGRSLWWSWTAPTNGTVLLKTAGSQFYTLLGVYTGSSVSNLTRVASDNGVFESSGTAQVSFNVIAGTEYEIAVDGLNGDFGRIVLSLNFSLDKKAPTISISLPAAGAKLTNSTVLVRGKAADNLAVGQVQYRLENEVGTNIYETATGTTDWFVTVSNLPPGLNTVRVRAVDTSGNVSATVARSFTYLVLSPLTLITNGNGAITPNLNGKLLDVGFSYTVTAKPASAAYLFAGWTNGVVSSSAKLTFVMQSNLVLQANFVPNPFIPVAGNFQGLFYDTNDVTPRSSGFVSALVKSSGAFSAKLLLAGKTYSSSGQFLLDGSYSNSIARKGLSPIGVQLQLDLAGDTLAGLISDSTNWTAELLANRAVFAKTNQTPLNGKYTLLIPGAEESETAPGGDGFGTVTVDTLGNITITGTLADGTKVSQKTFVSGGGLWPFYASLYSGNGSVFGWLAITNEATNDMDGLVTWFKLPQANSKFYPGGFTNNQPNVVASRYQFTNNVPVLNFSTGQVWLANGNLSQSFTNTVVLGTNNKVVGTNKLSFTITTASGAFKGSAISPDTGKAIPFSGVILEKQGFGGGFFLGTNQAGRVFFGGP